MKRLSNICTNSDITKLSFMLLVRQNGQNNRKYAATGANNKSSRSHTLFRVHLEVLNKDDQTRTQSLINLVDLAGSEGLRNTGNVGNTKKEGQNINKSLLALSNVTRNLCQGKASGYINYRDSKLTRILQNSLGGNCKTSVICNVNPNNQAESINTLKFGVSAGQVKLTTRVNSTGNSGFPQVSTKKQMSERTSGGSTEQQQQQKQMLRQQIDQLVVKFQQLNQKNQQLYEQVSVLKRVVAAKDEDINQLLKDIDHFRDAQNNIKERSANKMLQIDQLNEQNLRLRAELDKKDLELQELRSGRAKLVQQVSNMNTNEKTLLKKISALEAKLVQAEKATKQNSKSSNMFQNGPVPDPIQLARQFELRIEIANRRREIDSLNQINSELSNRVQDLEREVMDKEERSEEQNCNSMTGAVSVNHRKIGEKNATKKLQAFKIENSVLRKKELRAINMSRGLNEKIRELERELYEARMEIERYKQEGKSQRSQDLLNKMAADDLRIVNSAQAQQRFQQDNQIGAPQNLKQRSEQLELSMHRRSSSRISEQESENNLILQEN